MNLDESPPILFVCSDLIFTSKVSGTGQMLKRNVKTLPNAAAAIREARPNTPLAILDLGSPSTTTAEEMQLLRAALPASARLIAYGSHVDFERLREARAAGCDEVLPRSEFTKRLVELLTPDELA